MVEQCGGETRQSTLRAWGRWGASMVRSGEGEDKGRGVSDWNDQQEESWRRLFT